jgi:hypothetical protein
LVVVPELHYLHQPVNAISELETEDKENKKNCDILTNIQETKPIGC